MRPAFDPSITLSLVGVHPDGALTRPLSAASGLTSFAATMGPIRRSAARRPAGPPSRRTDTPVDAAWIVSRVHRAPATTGHRRLEAILFAQRTLSPLRTTSRLRELQCGGSSRSRHSGSRSSGSAHRHAGHGPRGGARTDVDDLRDEDDTRTAITLFQSTLGILTRSRENEAA